MPIDLSPVAPILITIDNSSLATYHAPRGQQRGLVGIKPTPTSAVTPRGETFRESVRMRDGPGFDVAEAALNDKGSEQIWTELNEQ